jgi:polysaccharide pyruvyl transferase WcaK-like protein
MVVRSLLREALASDGDPRYLELRFDGPSAGAPVGTAPAVSGDSDRRLAHGEPSPDLDALVACVRLSRVRTLDVSVRRLDLWATGATTVPRLVERLPALTQLTLAFGDAPAVGDTAIALDLHQRIGRPVRFGVDLVLDAGADAFDALGSSAARPTTSLVSVLAASRRLRAAGVAVRWIVPLIPALAYRLEALFSLAGDEGVDPVLAPVSRLRGTDGSAAAPLHRDERLFVLDFITYRLLDQEGHRHTAARIRWYRALRDALIHSGAVPAAALRRVTVLHGAGSRCGFRWMLRHEERPDLGASLPPSRSWRGRVVAAARPDRLLPHAIAMAEVVVGGSLAVIEWLRALGAQGRALGAQRRRARGDVTDGRLAKVLFIGAYGGEHIGDIAILGGVLDRLHRRHGTTEAVVLSQRPVHTRRLVGMLDTPFAVAVAAYERPTVRELLPRADAVVFAGGPLIDLPRQLVKHLYIASRATRGGKPFVMEGIGPGPFPRRPSEWVARRLVRMAQRISVRTSTDADHRLMRGLHPHRGRDPAFDYLATRGPQLTRLGEGDRRWIERLVRDTEGRLLVALNVRPIRHLFTAGVPAARRAAHTRDVEARFEARLADGMRRFHRASPTAPCFVFFPMNAIQFGLSDVRSAYRLERLLQDDVDLRVWEADPSLDGVVGLLRRVDIVVSMRFHATVFALAQGAAVIGIDYRVGERDKVAALLGDFGQTDNCCRIDEMTSDWLFERLRALAAARAPARPPR